MNESMNSLCRVRSKTDNQLNLLSTTLSHKQKNVVYKENEQLEQIRCSLKRTKSRNTIQQKLSIGLSHSDVTFQSTVWGTACPLSAIFGLYDRHSVR